MEFLYHMVLTSVFTSLSFPLDGGLLILELPAPGITVGIEEGFAE